MKKNIADTIKNETEGTIIILVKIYFRTKNNYKE